MPKTSRRQTRATRKETVLRQAIGPDQVHAFVDGLFHDDLHVKRVASLSDGTLGVLRSAALALHAIGRGLAGAKGLLDKHGVKQVDQLRYAPSPDGRLVGNEKIDVDQLSVLWTQRALAGRTEVFINLDWTEFDKDDQSMLVLSLQTPHGRALPLMWKTVVKSELKGQRNDHEDELVNNLAHALPEGVHATIVADRGFCDHTFFELLARLGLGYIIRLRSNIYVGHGEFEPRAAAEWVGPSGRMQVLRQATVTAQSSPVGTVVVVQDKGMQDIWCLACSDSEASGAELKRVYGKRFSCEETFRDIKDIRYGMGMSWTRISKPYRRDRLMLLAVLAQALLTLLGEAGEASGLDRHLKTNTSSKRTLSLLRQGLRWFDLIPNMPEVRLRPLMVEFNRLLREDALFHGLLDSYRG